MRPASSRSWYRSSTSRAIAVPDASPRPDNSASHNSSSPDAVCFASDDPARRSRVRPRSDIDVRRSEKNALFMIVPSRPARCRGKLVYRIGRQFAPIIARIKELQQECFGLVARMRIVGDLRLWPRLLPRTTLIDGEVCSRVRERFDVTPPRFDLMARLDKAPDGMTLSDVSKQMMISSHNVTGLVKRLVDPGASTGAHIGDRPARAGDPAAQGRPRRACWPRQRRPLRRRRGTGAVRVALTLRLSGNGALNPLDPGPVDASTTQISWRRLPCELLLKP